MIEANRGGDTMPAATSSDPLDHDETAAHIDDMGQRVQDIERRINVMGILVKFSWRHVPFFLAFLAGVTYIVYFLSKNWSQLF